MKPLLAAALLVGLSGIAWADSVSDRKADIDRLLDALKAAPNEQTASLIEDRLQQTWLRSGTASVTLLISKGLRQQQAGQNDDAVETFSDAITLQPDVSEAWHQRAIARYHAGDTQGAIRDLEETVRLEPRNFTAFRTLTEIAMAREDWKAAYESWQKVLEIDPKTPGGEERLKELKRKALGEET